MTKPRITFIGAGNMGQSLMGGLIDDGYPADKIWASNPILEHLELLHDKYAVKTTPDNLTAAKHGDVIVLCIKPQVLESVCKEIAEIAKDKLIISIAAGVTTTAISQWLGNDKYAIIRCMPNTPALVRCGASSLFANPHVSVEHKQYAESIMRAVGICQWVNSETDLDIITALSGSGPAYYFLLMEAMQAQAITLGLSPDIAHLFTLQTALGAARLAMESNQSPQQLRENVTSPGGTTAAAIDTLEQHDFHDIVAKAMTAAKQRAEDIAQNK